MTPLFRIVYISRNEIPGSPDDVDRHVAQILAASRRNNALADVTGALVFHDGCFAQVLEGANEAIESVFERIQCDERHSHVELLSFEPVERRGFAGWDMAYTGASADFDGVVRHDERDVATWTGDVVYALIRRHLFGPAGLAIG
ncbi:BLUF domain-containing protein [Ilumatobacter sp.]|uniref:BLUF domain-containing protein n=1 Tax=Ilumatobacter sp. TaxID=1967498 RepID=UPI003B529EA7